MPMRTFIRHYLLALQFFSRVPVTGRLADWVGFSPAMLRASAAHFPGVGWLVGGAAAAVTAVLLYLLPAGPMAPLVAAVLATVLTVMMTGGLHEDGLADVADGLGGTLNRERALEIMKDSRVGAFGAMALMLALLAKVALLALLGSVGAAAMVGALFAGHVVSRGWPLLIIRVLPHVGDSAQSKSKPLAGQISITALLIAALWCVVALALSLAAPDLVRWAGRPSLPETWPQMVAGGVVASALAWLWMWRWLSCRLQGFTGDCLGAAQQVCEISFYLGMALACGAVA